MDYLEKVEKIREKTGVSYEDAKAALEACEYDVLDALVYLEKAHKIPAPKSSVYSTEDGQQSEEFAQTQENYEKDCKKKSSGDTWKKFFKWCEKMLKKSCENSFQVIRHEKTVVNIPVLILVICLICAFWVTVPLLIVGMFFGCKYHFEGMENASININDMCEKASEACENIKNDLQTKKEE